MAGEKNLRTKPEKDRTADQPDVPDRDEELSTQTDVREALISLYKDVEKGFMDQYERANDQTDFWDTYNCKLGPKQFYTGNSKIYVPIVYDAVNARKTRFTNQIFPASGRNVEVTTEDGTYPYAVMALAEYYIRKTQLRTKIMPALMKCGDIEGQYNLYVTWRKTKRHVVWRVTKDVPESGEKVEDIQEDEIVHGCPDIEVLSDSDVLVLPTTADSLEEALACGGSVTILRRWSKTRLLQAVADGDVVKSVADAMTTEMTSENRGQYDPNRTKKMAAAAGIKGEGAGKYIQLYETWTRLNIDGDRRIVRAYFGSEKQLLGCKRNPFWSDHLPIISAPVEKVHGSFKGRSKVEPVCDLQYQANDAANQGMDSASYALSPIVITDPARNPRTGSMILSMAAIWEADPKSTQFAQFPPLWKDALEIVAACKNQIKESLGVNPAMITQAPGKAKRNQAEVAQEQAVDILTTADAVTVIEESMLTPLLNRMIELDHQYRDDDLTVRQFGPMGQKAEMERIPPIQMNRRYQFRWFGVEAARNAQQVQQQIAGLNVLRGIPPEMLGGHKLNMAPAIVQFVESTFGPRLAPLVLEPPEEQMPVPIEQEQMMLIEGFEVPLHQMDDDQAHIQAHGQLMHIAQSNENTGSGVVRKIQTHIWKHMQQMQAKQQAQMQQGMSQAGGSPGAPGGAGPGLQGSPRPGAQPAAPRGGQNPPGMIHQDRLRDPNVMPRKM